MLELLRRIRADVSFIRDDVNDLKARVSIMEQTQGQILTLIGSLNQRIYRFDERLGRIERRLELVDA